MKRALAGAVVLLAGCVSGAPRPVKPSVEEVFPATPAVVYQAALKAVTDQGLPLGEADPSTRVIETSYVDMTSFRPLESSAYPTSERQVRFRVIVSPNQEGTGSVVAIFGLYAPFRSGYSTSERNERAIPRDHPGMALVRSIRDAVAAAVGR
jgi:hypothetical protein